MIVGQLFQFLIGPILHRVRSEPIGRVGTKSLRLHRRRLDELSRRHSNRRNSAGFQIREVMRTARRAGASVSQPFNHDINLPNDLPP